VVKVEDLSVSVVFEAFVYSLLQMVAQCLQSHMVLLDKCDYVNCVCSYTFQNSGF